MQRGLLRRGVRGVGGWWLSAEPPALPIGHTSHAATLSTCRCAAGGWWLVTPLTLCQHVGVQLVATAHGNELENLVKNPSMADLVGGIQVWEGSRCERDPV